MQKRLNYLFFFSALAFISYTTQAQLYRTSTTAALENNGTAWVEKKLPASVITFSEYSGQVEIKTMVASLTAQQDDSSAAIQSMATDCADFMMSIDRDQLSQQTAVAKTFTTTGTLTINNTSKNIAAQYLLEPRNSGEGLIISVIIRFNPADFNLQIKNQSLNEPLIVKVNGGYLNRQLKNF